MLETDAQLIQAFGFTAEDIAANRLGKLTWHQKIGHLAKKLFYGALLSSIEVFAGAILIQGANGDIDHIWLGLVFIIFGCLFGFGAIQLLDWMEAPTVSCASGQVTFETKKGQFHLCVERASLLVKPDVKSMFTPDQKYDVYYTALFGTIFSIETAKDYTNAPKHPKNAPKYPRKWIRRRRDY